MTDTTVYLKDYQPPVFAVESIHLDFDLYDDHALVENSMRLKRLYQGALYLYGDELELVSIHLDGKPLDSSKYRRQGDDLILDTCPDECTLTIKTRIQPQNNTQLSGLYRSNQLFCTQCEAEGFRRITFFPDRPDVLTLFTTKITADKQQYPVLLSNGNLIAEGQGPGSRHWVVWEDPFKKPSYLFALVAGKLACVQDTFVTSSNKTVDLRIYVEPGNEDKCAHAMTSVKKAMQWDEIMYGREYDLSIFMIVAVSDFNMGAMENKGLNIFNIKYILARPETATDQDFMDIEGVVGHEYFHNWTGNRVTCRDWFQLSLKEGLTVFRDQEFSRDMNSRDVCRIQDVQFLLASQFPEDAGAMAHPVRPKSYEEINNFYTPTIYHKGAEVIRMQQTLLGAEGFRRGMDLYFERHDGQAVTIDDFVTAMEDANGVDFKQFRRWYDQAGTPCVSVTSDFAADTLTLSLTQSCPATPECQKKLPYHIPIRLALFDNTGKPIPLDKDVLELKEAEQTFMFHNLPHKPYVSLLRDFSAPIRLQQEQTTEERLALLRFETNGYAKWEASQNLAFECFEALTKKDPATWKMPDELAFAFAQVLDDENLDPALRALLFFPPGFEEVFAFLTTGDVDAVETIRDTYRQQLGSSLYEQIKLKYQTLLALGNNGGSQAAGYRKLQNSCLWLMMKAAPAESVALCKQQFDKACTMTEQLASFSLLVNCPIEDVHQETISRFYKQWAKDELVMDKWLSVQAMCELPNTLAKVESLLSHPTFSMKNPNKVRSLIGAFANNNPRNFHAPDGSGYSFLCERILELDKINPQVAARLATPFTRWHRFDSARASLMQVKLQYLQERVKSRDLKELVTKSLGSEPRP